MEKMSTIKNGLLQEWFCENCKNHFSEDESICEKCFTEPSGFIDKNNDKYINSYQLMEKKLDKLFESGVRVYFLNKPTTDININEKVWFEIFDDNMKRKMDNIFKKFEEKLKKVN